MSFPASKRNLDQHVPEFATWRDYLAIARLDHSSKHVFILPGIVFALLLRGIHVDSVGASIALGFTCAACIASANYVINEWLDRDFDKHHPVKSLRAAVQKPLVKSYVLLEWAALVSAGLTAAYMASGLMFAVACLFALQGVVYNVPPIRTKDISYLDVISESINNPVRLMIGWAMIDSTTLPPASIVLMYWTGGAFLMTAKRLSEYRDIVESHGKQTLARYRASFAGYSETTLTAACLCYALFSIFFLAIFLVKYRVEYLLTVPVIVVIFTYYYVMTIRPDSTAQKPERLFRERTLMALLVALVATFSFATIYDVPALETLASQKFVQIR